MKRQTTTNDRFAGRERRARAASIVALAMTLVSASTTALAAAPAAGPRPEPAKKQCKRAAERGQQLKLDGKLTSAREELRQCTRQVCPSVVRSYCAKWFDEVEAAMPSVVVRVHDEAGNDVADAAVSVDEVPNTSWREGLPLELDPGEHTFTFARPGDELRSSHVRLGTGEKNRSVTLIVPGPKAQAMPAPEAAPSEAFAKTPEGEGRRAPPSVATWIVGGVAIAAFGTAAYLGITGQPEYRQARDACPATGCSQDQLSAVDAAWRKLVVADVALGAGILATGAATWIFFATRGKSQEPAAVAGLRVIPSTTGVGLRFDARF